SDSPRHGRTATQAGGERLTSQAPTARAGAEHWHTSAMTRVDLASISPAIPLGPLDGRYRAAAAPLVNHLSEAALNRARLEVEVEWLIHLTGTGALPGAPELSEAEITYLRDVVTTFGQAEIADMAEIETETRPAVKAVESCLDRPRPAAPPLPARRTAVPQVSPTLLISWTWHYASSLSSALTVAAGVREEWLPAAREMVDATKDRALANADVPTL